MTYITHMIYMIHLTYVSCMIYIIYITYINHNYVSCLGYKNTQFKKSYYEKVNFSKCLKN